jgi:broad specificity phosphatase PhoE
MSLKVYLLRHGETVYSRTGGYCGDLDPDLTPEGELMGKGFAENYHSLPWDAVYVSPKKRTIATAKPLCDKLGMEMQLRDGLKEIAYGKWEGETVDFVKQNYSEDYLRWLSEPAWNAPTGGETSVQIANRAMPVITEIQQKYSTGNVLVVSHKATIRIILCSLLGIDLGSYRNRVNILAASVSVVKFGARGPLLESLGDRYHLPDDLRGFEGT